MRLSLLALTVAFLVGGFGCEDSQPGPDMDHRVDVPLKFHEGRGARNVPSNHERYLEAYEEGWWDCVERFAADIEHGTVETEKAAVGGPVRIQGYRNGFEDAQERIRSNASRYGRERTREHLQRLLVAP